jgi:hypothetical protein
MSRIEDEIVSIFESIAALSRKRRRVSSEIFLIRIASGGSQSAQEVPISTVINIILTKLLKQNIKARAERKDPKLVHRYGPKAYVDWLLESDFHLISTHIHQGNYFINRHHVIF